MPMKRTWQAMAAITLLSAGSCQFATGCDMYAAPGLSITARDAATGASIQGNDVRVILSAERQADTTRSLPASLAYESPGTYTVVLEVPGYLRWERTGIRVRADQCHVKTVQVTADLRREG
ncbi:MAG: carboxypeptidase-like regulatory domain-containing protein [Gemmatimonas sp.]|jgi:hypothetical protein